MKTLKIFLITTLFIAIANFAIAQKVKTETFKVSGECGMCKKKIETAAKNAGATNALWSSQTKMLKVTYAATVSSSAIQQKIADTGYDTPQFKATDEAYNSLDKCCQYERAVKEQTCCGVKCDMKDGKCTDEAACKEKGCCKDSEKCKEMGCCMPGSASSADAKSCCKKAE
jgi:hypothetical protein